MWLDSVKTSPYQFYQFWFNVSDDVVDEFLFKMTLLSKEDIEQVMRTHGEDKAARFAQMRLAREVTTLVHGARAAESAEKVSGALFGTVALTDISDDVRSLLASEAPNADIKIGIPIVDALVVAGLASSKREARQFVEDKAISIAGNRIEDVTQTLVESDFVQGVALLKRGKRHVAVLVIDA